MTRVCACRGILGNLSHIDQVQLLVVGGHCISDDLTKSMQGFLLLVWVLNVLQLLESQIFGLIFEELERLLFKFSHQLETVLVLELYCMLLLHMGHIFDFLRHYEGE